MSSGAAFSRARGFGSRTLGTHVVALVATAAFCVAPLTLTALSADAAPYPPTQPCSVTATARDTGTYDVVGSGLGSTQPVRVVLARTGQQVGSAETDTNGAFRTVVTAAPDADASAPDITASSPRQSCTTPPTSPTAPPSSEPSRSVSAGPTTSGAPTGGSGGSGGAGQGGGGQSGTGQADGGPDGSGGQGGGTTAGSTGGSGTGASSPAGAGSGTSAPASGGSSAPGSPGASTPAVAEPIPGTDTPFGIGLGIAAVLLVLGTLAVLLLTRRSER